MLNIRGKGEERASVGSSEARFLRLLFQELENSAIRYAVMRNYETLPYSAGGSDIDILVAGKDIEAAKRVLLECVIKVEGRIIGAVQTWNFVEFYLIALAGDRWWGVCVEFYSDVAFKSAVPLVDIATLHHKIQEHNGVSVISRDVGNTIGYIKEVLVHGDLKRHKPQYKESALSLIKHQQNVFRTVFSPLGHRSQILLRDLLEGASPAECAVKSRWLRFSVLISAFTRSPLLFLYKICGHQFFRVSRLLNPPGTVLAILGVDGAGKSTVINAILPALKEATHNAVFVQHLRPSFLPPLSRLKRVDKVAMEPVTTPHGSEPSGVLGSLLRLSYLTVDYVLGYWIKTRPRIAKRPAVVIFDRYAYDMALDPRRFRIGLSRRVAGWFAALAPKPDLIICLHGDPDVIAARKKELPVEETRRQVAALRAFGRNEPRAVLIATDTSIEETRDRVLQTLCEFLEKKAGKQF